MSLHDVIPWRWAELISLDHSYTLLELEKIAARGFTGVTLWNSFEWERQADIDNYVYALPLTYRRQADLNALRDQDMIRRGADFLDEFTRRAHRLGLTVQHVYHLCNFVGVRFELVSQLRLTGAHTGLQDLRPQWFNEHREIAFDRPDFYRFMADEVEDFFDAFPGVDGLFCWNCECSTFTPSRLKRQRVGTVEIARGAIGAVYEVCQRRGKVMTHDIHTAGANADLTAAIIEAAGDYPELILGGDVTYSDWHMLLPTTPWLERMKKRNRIYVGFDAAGEFFGQGRTVGAWPRWITTHFTNIRPHTPALISVRAGVNAPENSAALVPLLDLNLQLLVQLARTGAADLDDVMARWWRDHFTGQFPAGLTEIVRGFEDYLEKTLYINGTNITEYNPDHGFPRKAVHVAPGYPCWHSEQFTRPGTPIAPIMCRMIPPWGHRSRPIGELRQEKLDAIAICDRLSARLRELEMAQEDRRYFLRRLHQARDVAEAFLLTIDVVYPLYQIVGEHHDRAMTDPRGELRRQLSLFRGLAHAMEQRWGSEFYRRFAPKMRQFADDIPAELYQPIKETVPR